MAAGLQQGIGNPPSGLPRGLHLLSVSQHVLPAEECLIYVMLCTTAVLSGLSKVKRKVTSHFWRAYGSQFPIDIAAETLLVRHEECGAGHSEIFPLQLLKEKQKLLKRNTTNLWATDEKKERGPLSQGCLGKAGAWFHWDHYWRLPVLSTTEIFHQYLMSHIEHYTGKITSCYIYVYINTAYNRYKTTSAKVYRYT